MIVKKIEKIMIELSTLESIDLRDVLNRPEFQRWDNVRELCAMLKGATE